MASIAALCVCKLQTASDQTPDGQIHHVLGHSNKIWCPYIDDKSFLEAFEKEQKERTQAAWCGSNEAKRLKKKQLSFCFLLCCYHYKKYAH